MRKRKKQRHQHWDTPASAPCAKQNRLGRPDGERNAMSWRAPKRVWVHGGSLLQAFCALTELAAAGIVTVVEPDSPLASYTADLEGLLQVNSKPESTGVHHVAALSPLDSSRKQELAKRDGATHPHPPVRTRLGHPASV